MSGSSLGLSGAGYTFYSGSDSGTESSSHHSISTVKSYDYFYDHGAKYLTQDGLYIEDHLNPGGAGGLGGGGGYKGRYYDDYYLEEEPFYHDIIYTDSCSSCSESYESISTYFDPEFFYADFKTESRDANSDSNDSTYYRKEPKCARAYMTDAHQSLVYGHVDFKMESIYTVDYKKGVQIIGEMEGVWPPGLHAIGIHEYGDLSHHCENTGGRFNPKLSRHHGSPDSKEKFAGDLGNILAKRDGRAYYYRWESALTLDGDNSIIGKPVVLKIGEDDFGPYDHSGPPIACGIIDEIACASEDESAFSDDDNYSESDDHYSSASSQGDSF